jgi:hypothetical protein
MILFVYLIHSQLLSRVGVPHDDRAVVVRRSERAFVEGGPATVKRM